MTGLEGFIAFHRLPNATIQGLLLSRLIQFCSAAVPGRRTCQGVQGTVESVSVRNGRKVHHGVFRRGGGTSSRHHLTSKWRSVHAEPSHHHAAHDTHRGDHEAPYRRPHGSGRPRRNLIVRLTTHDFPPFKIGLDTWIVSRRKIEHSPGKLTIQLSCADDDDLSRPPSPLGRANRVWPSPMSGTYG